MVGSWFGVGQVVSRFSRASALPPPMASSSDGCTEGQQSEKNDRFCKRQKRHSSLSFIELFYNWARNSHFCTLLCHTVSPWPMADAVALRSSSCGGYGRIRLVHYSHVMQHWGNPPEPSEGWCQRMREGVFGVRLATFFAFPCVTRRQGTRYNIRVRIVSCVIPPFRQNCYLLVLTPPNASTNPHRPHVS